MESPRTAIVTGASSGIGAATAVGQTDDRVNACLFLLSDAASWITGQIVNVDGGQISRP